MKQQLPDISVIIISYNEREYLETALTSCLSQEDVSIEILIGDDGSDDGSMELISSYERQYPDIVSSFVMDRSGDPKQFIIPVRVSDLIKEGLSRARGRYAVILSGDDYFCYNRKFIEAVTFLDNHTNYAAFLSGYKRVFPDGKEERFLPVLHRSLFWGKEYLHISCFVFRRNICENGLLQRFCDDTGMIYSIACAGKWKNSPGITFAYRQRGGSIMHSSDNVLLNMYEMMIFQDIQCKRSGKYIFMSCSRYCKPLQQLIGKESEIAKITNLIADCKKYDHDICSDLINYSHDPAVKKRIDRLLFKCKIAKVTVDILSIPERIIKKLMYLSLKS